MTEMYTNASIYEVNLSQLDPPWVNILHLFPKRTSRDEWNGMDFLQAGGPSGYPTISVKSSKTTQKNQP